MTKKTGISHQSVVLLLCVLISNYANDKILGVRILKGIKAYGKSKDRLDVVGQNFLENYQGKPWNNQPQQIPGKIQCELFDLGGQNIAYFDKDSINNGSGKLNPANGTFLNEFRMKEAVDISYTKARDIDNSPYNVVEPLMGELYVGWTTPGEWINYTVKVNKTGTYSIGIMYTANGDGGIAFLLDGKAISSEILIPSTRNDNETIAWRQWHHWNKIQNLTTVKLKKGVHILTLKTVTNGNMNYDYVEFKLANSAKKN